MEFHKNYDRIFIIIFLKIHLMSPKGVIIRSIQNISKKIFVNIMKDKKKIGPMTNCKMKNVSKFKFFC